MFSCLSELCINKVHHPCLLQMYPTPTFGYKTMLTNPKSHHDNHQGLLMFLITT